MKNKISKLLKKQVTLHENFGDASFSSDSRVNQIQTKDAFSEKWKSESSSNLTDDNGFIDFQKKWFMKLYGFKSEADIKRFFDGKVILDAGCGIGYKTAWIAEMVPSSIIIGVDISESIFIASKKYKNLENLFFIKGDIVDTPFKSETFDIVVCDQVIMHTEKVNATFKHLGSLIKNSGSFLCYVYAKKALVRELIDDYFREKVHEISKEELWELSSQLTKLGKNLTELKLKIDVPEVPLLGIKKGEYDIQRFIYWNFIKCFYRDDWDLNSNDVVNFDWYSPANAKRFSEEEFKKLITKNNFDIEFFHIEEACYSGRFNKII